MLEKLVIFEKETTTAEIIQNYLKECDDIEIDKVFDDYSEGVRYVKSTKPKVVLFSMTSDKVLNFKMIKRLVEFKTNVIVLSEDYTTSNIVQVLRNGAKDFVSKPIIKKDLIVSIIKCTQENIKVLNKSQIITIYSNKGGIGKTAIATNLAIELNKLTKERIALVDLNLPIGDVATFLDVKPNINISEVINSKGIDKPDFIKDISCQYKNTNLYVLAEPPFMEQSRTLNPKQIIKLFEVLKQSFSYIVIDMGASVDKLNMSILENSDLILLTTVVNLPLIRNCQRCLDLFENLQYPDSKIKILINRYLENDEISIDDVEKTLNRKIYWKIPNNYYTMMSSINKGIPVSEINEKSNITESFSGLASKIAEDMLEHDIS